MRRILSVAVKAESASGKSFLTDTVLKLFPEEAYISVSSLSPKALYYDTDDYQHRMLIIAEAAGIGPDAEYTLRTLLSENTLKLKTVDKDAKGRNTLRTLQKEGPTGLIFTTTKARMNLENETRYLSIGLDESEEQSQRIKDATAARWENGAASVDLEAWINAQKLLDPVEVRIPFSRFLSDRTPTKPRRIRRDFDKLMLLIAASAALHQRQRKQLGTTKEGKKIIEASAVDYFYAKELFETVFFQSLYGIHPNTRKVMDAIKKLYQASNASAQPKGATVTNEICVTTQDLVHELDFSKTTVLKWAEPLEAYGWLVTQGEGKPNEYRLGVEPEPKKSALPTLDELIAEHPELVPDTGLHVTHPVDGQTVKIPQSRSQGAGTPPRQSSFLGDTIVCRF